jgi:4'-phosphopantetheinyl transferase
MTQVNSRKEQLFYDRCDPHSVAAELDDRGVHVWRIDLGGDDCGYTEMRALLSRDECERAARFRFDVDRRRFVKARAAVREIVGAYIGSRPEKVIFAYGEYGKPSVLSSDGRSDRIQFNVSHAADLALCVVTKSGDVGVDVESVREDLDVTAIADRVFSDDERCLLADSTDRASTFARIWVRKEACVKASGVGIGGDLSGFSVGLADLSRVGEVPGGCAGGWVVRELPVDAGFAAAVATHSPLSLRLFGFRR